MPDEVKVTPEDLHLSAATVDVHADDMHARHFAADGRMEAAQPGLPTGSSAALTGAVTKWQADTTALFGLSTFRYNQLLLLFSLFVLSRQGIALVDHVSVVLLRNEIVIIWMHELLSISSCNEHVEVIHSQFRK